MAKKATKRVEAVEVAARHCLDDLPYRMIVFSRASPHGVPLYLVAGSTAAAAGAEKALRTAHKIHGGVCFYCKETISELSIDHVEPARLGGKSSLQNLVIACKPCNLTKGHQPIEVYKPDAGREWLGALLKQVEDRLNRLR